MNYGYSGVEHQRVRNTVELGIQKVRSRVTDSNEQGTQRSLTPMN
jgi:hypothetical protein